MDNLFEQESEVNIQLLNGKHKITEIRGLDESDIDSLAKEMRIKFCCRSKVQKKIRSDCNIEDVYIELSGKHEDKLVNFLNSKGYKNVNIHGF